MEDRGINGLRGRARVGWAVRVGWAIRVSGRCGPRPAAVSASKTVSESVFMSARVSFRGYPSQLKVIRAGFHPSESLAIHIRVSTQFLFESSSPPNRVTFMPLRVTVHVIRVKFLVSLHQFLMESERNRERDRERERERVGERVCGGEREPPQRTGPTRPPSVLSLSLASRLPPIERTSPFLLIPSF